MLTQFSADCCNRAIILTVARHPLPDISPMPIERAWEPVSTSPDKRSTMSSPASSTRIKRRTVRIRDEGNDRKAGGCVGGADSCGDGCRARADSPEGAGIDRDQCAARQGMGRDRDL